MKKLLIPILAISFFTGLYSQGFMFVNKTGHSIKLDIEAEKLNGKKELRNIELKNGQAYMRRDWGKIDGFTATTMKKDVYFWTTDKEEAKIKSMEVLSEHWERDIESKSKMIRKIKIYKKNNRLRYKSYWKKPEKCGVICSGYPIR
ncbi:hypothetical protein GF385_02175 [Candidatus Dependentiae bacterium]|nr:hypothetical protein [Candidatus Dependentiae bacterium]